MKTNLFSSWYNSLLTIFFAYILLSTIPGLINWLFFDATFFSKSAKECSPDGACWGVVTQRFSQYVYGFYPDDLLWRPTLSLLLLIFALIPIFWDSCPKRNKALIFSALYPLIAGWLIFGGLGLVSVETEKIGGLVLTLIIGITGVSFSLPIGILVALGRRSKMPIVSTLSIMYIELVRAVPLITFLFVAVTVLPLFLPEGTHFDQLARVLILVVLFASAYVAEVIRGGLQAIPKGQFEGAYTIGLNYFQMMRLIILPQAIKISIPGLVNIFVGLFKDTTLVVIIGMFDIFAIGRAALADQKWITLSTEVYIFVGAIFFIFCFSMSRYATYLEKKLSRGYKK